MFLSWVVQVGSSIELHVAWCTEPRKVSTSKTRSTLTPFSSRGGGIHCAVPHIMEGCHPRQKRTFLLYEHTEPSLHPEGAPKLGAWYIEHWRRDWGGALRHSMSNIVQQLVKYIFVQVIQLSASALQFVLGGCCMLHQYFEIVGKLIDHGARRHQLSMYN